MALEREVFATGEQQNSQVVPTGKVLRPLDRRHVTFSDSFLGFRQDVNRSATIPYIEEQMRKAGRFAGIESDAKPKPDAGWECDVLEWVEAASYELSAKPDPRVRALIHSFAESLKDCLQADGYLQQRAAPGKVEERWRDMRDNHRLYALGHFMEGAIAWFEASGERNLLTLAEKVSHHIATAFGTGPGQTPGYCGHPQIELALIRLYHATGDARHLDLAAYFINQRGQSPNFFETEPGTHYFDEHFFRDMAKPWVPAFNQSHLPVREQTTAEGHAVRAVYLYCAMTDLAGLTGDAALLEACRKIWTNLTTRKMYITGGIGSNFRNEGFGGDYDLPNVESYCETCAAVSLVFWSHRMTQVDLDSRGRPDGRYADVMERALYNGVTSGVSLDGKKFLYWNKLHATNHDLKSLYHDHRQPWFGCACCPPNVARLLASLGDYGYSQGEDSVAVHLYASGSAALEANGKAFTLHQKSDYPWWGEIEIRVETDQEVEFELQLRIPGWCREWSVSLNGEPVPAKAVRGYLSLRRTWRSADKLVLNLEMPVEQIHANPRVRVNRGRIALQRGPLVYCFEEIDNGGNPDNTTVCRGAKAEVVPAKNLGPGALAIHVDGIATSRQGWDDPLYRPQISADEERVLTAVPYCLWDNRGTGEMLVWIRESA